MRGRGRQERGLREVLEDEVDYDGDVEALVVGGHDDAVLRPAGARRPLSLVHRRTRSRIDRTEQRSAADLLSSVRVSRAPLQLPWGRPKRGAGEMKMNEADSASADRPVSNWKELREIGLG